MATAKRDETGLLRSAEGVSRDANDQELKTAYQEAGDAVSPGPKSG